MSFGILCVELANFGVDDRRSRIWALTSSILLVGRTARINLRPQFECARHEQPGNRRLKDTFLSPFLLTLTNKANHGHGVTAKGSKCHMLTCKGLDEDFD